MKRSTANAIVIAKILGDLQDLDFLASISLSQIGRQARRLRILIEDEGIELPPEELHPSNRSKWL